MPPGHPAERGKLKPLVTCTIYTGQANQLPAPLTSRVGNLCTCGLRLWYPPHDARDLMLASTIRPRQAGAVCTCSAFCPTARVMPRLASCRSDLNRHGGGTQEPITFWQLSVFCCQGLAERDVEEVEIGIHQFLHGVDSPAARKVASSFPTAFLWCCHDRHVHRGVLGNIRQLC